MRAARLPDFGAAGEAGARYSVRARNGTLSASAQVLLCCVELTTTRERAYLLDSSTACEGASSTVEFGWC